MSEVLQVGDNHIIALLIFLISFTGVICNTIVAVYTHTLNSMNNAFGRLTACQSVAEAILCSVFAFYFSPMVMMSSDWMVKYSSHAGWINLICYDVCIWSHLFISANRLCAICMPLKYDYYFCQKNTRILMFVSWLIPIITAIALYKVFPCDFYYSEMLFAFIFSNNAACNFISWSIDFYKDISIVLVIACLDVFTIYSVHKSTIEMNVNNTQLLRRRKREVNFLKQAVLQGIVFTIELLTYFYFAWKFESKYMIFALTTLAWNIVHCTDAIIILTFNREFRALMLRPFVRIQVVGYSSSGVQPDTMRSTSVRNQA